MSSHGWRILYRIIKREARRLPRPRRRYQYSDVLIAAMFFWAVGHDRPLCWATLRSSYHSLFRPRRLPSNAAFNRRVRSARFAQLLQRIFIATRSAPPADATLLLDARPLPVGACSKDRHAKPGRVYSGFARGYRVHALVTSDGGVLAFELTAMNVAEPDVALRLLPQASPGALVLSDGGNDSARVYAAAEQCGVRFRARPRKNAGRGHCRQSPARLCGIADWRANDATYRRKRLAVERIFAWQSNFGGGLSPLPAWVRTPARTLRWVTAKLAIYHVRRRLQQAVA